MTTSILRIFAGMALLYGGAEALVRGSVSIAERVGLTPLVIGLTVVAFGTSMPELVVSIDAARHGRGAIAVGNIVGSNIGNIALILGTAALIRPTNVRAQVIRFEIPIVVAVSLIVSLMLFDGQIGNVSGVVLLCALAAYVTICIRKARTECLEIEKEFAEGLPEVNGNAWVDVLFVLVGLGLLVGGARMMVSGSVTIAEIYGVSQAVIGLTIVAIGTSLPELATSVVAAVKGEGDIAVGNIVGSNLFNMLGILGLAALINPMENAHVGLVSLGLMTLLSLALLPVMSSGERVSRTEGVLLVAVYAAYMVYLIP